MVQYRTERGNLSSIDFIEHISLLKIKDTTERRVTLV